MYLNEDCDIVSSKFASNAILAMLFNNIQVAPVIMTLMGQAKNVSITGLSL